MAKKNIKNTKKNSEFSSEIDPSAVSWQLFEKTKDINYYRLYSAIKDNDKNN